MQWGVRSLGGRGLINHRSGRYVSVYFRTAMDSCTLASTFYYSQAIPANRHKRPSGYHNKIISCQQRAAGKKRRWSWLLPNSNLEFINWRCSASLSWLDEPIPLNPEAREIMIALDLSGSMEMDDMTLNVSAGATRLEAAHKILFRILFAVAAGTELA